MHVLSLIFYILSFVEVLGFVIDNYIYNNYYSFVIACVHDKFFNISHIHNIIHCMCYCVVLYRLLSRSLLIVASIIYHDFICVGSVIRIIMSSRDISG